jgi:6-phosphogluconolactonase
VRGIQVFPDPASLAEAAVDLILGQAMEALERRGLFSLVLAGGSTPKAAYALLASPAYAARLDWSRVHIFFGDERCVPPNHPDSNFNMAQESLLSHVPLPKANVHRIPTEASPGQAAKEYEGELQAFYPGADPPAFDLVLLGMGEDGHVASLFPGSPALEEQVHWVVPVPHSQPPPPLVDRVSLTLPAINAARQVVMMVAGSKKAARLRQVLSEGPTQSELLPAQRVQPNNQQLVWLVDKAALGEDSNTGVHDPRSSEGTTGAR